MKNQSPVRCEHCGDPAKVRPDGRVLHYRREPICSVCEYLLRIEGPEKEFLDFLKSGGKVVGPQKKSDARKR